MKYFFCKFIFFTIVLVSFHSFAKTEPLTIKKDDTLKITKQNVILPNIYQFSGQKGDTIDLKIKALSNNNPLISVTSPSNKEISSPCTEKYSDEEDKLNNCDFITEAWKKILPEDGVYQISLNTMEPVNLSYEMIIQHSSASKTVESEDFCNSKWNNNQTDTPLDQTFNSCLAEKKYSQLGERECLTQSMNDWDKQLNVFYHQLMKFNRGNFQELKKSQINWIAHRDADYQYIESLYANEPGSMYPNIILRQKLSLIKNRTLELRQYLILQCVDS